MGLLFELFLFHYYWVVLTLIMILLLFFLKLYFILRDLSRIMYILNYVPGTDRHTNLQSHSHIWWVNFPSKFESALQTHWQLSTVFTPLTFQVLVICIPTPPRTIWQPVCPRTPWQALSCILMDATHGHKIMPVKCQAVRLRHRPHTISNILSR